MQPIRINLRIHQGASWHRIFVWCGADGAPINLTGCVARAQFRSEADDEEVLCDLGKGFLSVGGEDGRITLSIPAATTETFGWVTAVYDLLIVFPDGTVQRLLNGSVKNVKGVTRD